jgi:arginyl-tRNA synthetase
VAEAAAQLRGGEPIALGRLERPPRPDFGDYSTNAAMLLAGSLGEPPRAVAEKLAELVRERMADSVSRVEVAGPGFLNLWVSDAWAREALSRMLAEGERWGAGAPEQPERILLEFVSANPTGPITVASGRHAAYGDSLGRVLEFAGHEVEREYYVNDAGTQVRKFGESIKARATGAEPPEDGYPGEYVNGLVERIEGAADLDVETLARRGVELMVEDIAASLERFRVHMDRFFFEHLVHEAGAIDKAIALLEEQEHVYPSEGAVWFRSSSFGDDKDRVLMRSSGEYTYFAADIAYHEQKRERGYDRYINIWGADHHGHVPRMLGAWEAMGGEPGRLELLIMQLVNLVEHGQRLQVGKRRGVIETLDDLVEDIGVDAARFFMLQRSHDTTLDLDLAVARERSQENPVFYVQYAHARIASILRNATAGRVEEALATDLTARDDGDHPSARRLLKRLLELPAEVETAAERRAAHRMTAYAHDVAQDFSAFYRDCKVIGAAEEGADEDFRIALSVMAQRVIAKSLDLLGVSAPDQM